MSAIAIEQRRRSPCAGQAGGSRLGVTRLRAGRSRSRPVLRFGEHSGRGLAERCRPALVGAHQLICSGAITGGSASSSGSPIRWSRPTRHRGLGSGDTGWCRAIARQFSLPRPRRVVDCGAGRPQVRAAEPADGSDYVPNAYVPPHGIEGLASILLRVQDRTAWCSPAAARWLVLDNVGAQEVRPGSVVVITEGPRRVAYFHVTEVIDER